MQHIILKDADAIRREVADRLVVLISDTLKQSDRFTIALSGGSTPKKLFQLLASDPYRSQIDWAKLHFFWGDERFVPFEDEKNNAAMAFSDLLNKVPVVKDQVHIMNTSITSAESVKEYENILHKYFSEGAPSFDLVLLGLGDNSHTLSLFPGYPVVHEDKAWVYAFYLEEQAMERITLTKAIVNPARHIWYLVAGADKAPAVHRVMFGKPDPDRHPAQVIKASFGEITWFLDEAAAVEIKDAN